MTCQFQCLSDYMVSPPTIGNPASGGPQPGAVMSPYALVGLYKSKSKAPQKPTGPSPAINTNTWAMPANASSFITVGNQSSPNAGNTAVIKSLHVASAGIVEVTAEIVDEAGGEFTTFITNIADDIKTSNLNMFVDFGWIRSSCSTGSLRPYYLSSLKAPYGGNIYVWINKLDTAYEEGRIKFTIHGTGVLNATTSQRVSVAFGSEDHPQRLKSAIRSLFGNNDPRIPSVVFKRENGTKCPPGDGTEYGFRKSDGGCEGPPSAWAANQQQPLAVARNWLNSLPTDRGKGIYSYWNSMSPVPELVFAEDPEPLCNENTPSKLYEGTYIVGGGDCSPVISFSPTADWIIGTGLNPGNIKSGVGSFAQRGGFKQISKFVQGKEADCSKKDYFPQSGGSKTTTTPSGVQVFVSPPQSDINWRSPSTLITRVMEAMAAHLAASRNTRPKYKPIVADLKIQGDPRFTNPAIVVGGAHKVGIIVINPFHVVGSGGNCDWLSSPPCNPIFSSGSYRIMGADHQITAGSFVTTLKLTLLTKEQAISKKK